jgi:hypothetical protein
LARPKNFWMNTIPKNRRSCMPHFNRYERV